MGFSNNHDLPIRFRAPAWKASVDFPLRGISGWGNTRDAALASLARALRWNDSADSLANCLVVHYHGQVMDIDRGATRRAIRDSFSDGHYPRLSARDLLHRAAS